MADNTKRVRAWRQQQKDAGMVPLTLWVRAETKLRIEAMAVQSRRTVSALGEDALASYQLLAPVTVTDTDTEQLRELIDELLAQRLPSIIAHVTDNITVAAQQRCIPVTDTISVIAQHPAVPETATETTGYDSSKFYLGKLCPQNHDFEGTGRSLLRKHNQTCRECENAKKRAKRASQATERRTE